MKEHINGSVSAPHDDAAGWAAHSRSQPLGSAGKGVSAGRAHLLHLIVAELLFVADVHSRGTHDAAQPAARARPCLAAGLAPQCAGGQAPRRPSPGSKPRSTRRCAAAATAAAQRGPAARGMPGAWPGVRASCAAGLRRAVAPPCCGLSAAASPRCSCKRRA